MPTPEATTGPGVLRVRDLTERECRALLARQQVGRLAFFHDRRVDIEPVHYVMAGDWIVGRTSKGTKLEALGHVPYVAFEVDEVRSIWSWKSVVAFGTAYLMPPDGAPRVQQAFHEAVARLRTLVPQTLAPGDPVPFRHVVFGIHVDELSGRVGSLTRSRAGRAPRRSR